MATYSYSKAQLDKRDQPAKPFWSGNKIAATFGSLLFVSLGVLIVNAPSQPAPVAVAQPAPVAVAQPAPVASTEAVRDMPEACIKAKATRAECDQAIALYNAQQNQGPTWSGQEFNENQRKAWAK